MEWDASGKLEHRIIKVGFYTHELSERRHHSGNIGDSIGDSSYKTQAER
jgi:hypothetical protein